MDKNAETLFNYLRMVLYDPAQASLDIDRLDEDFKKLGKGLAYFADSLNEARALAQCLAKGDLSVPLPSPENELVSPLKSLHASLKHITWQSKQVAKGDYSQHIDFMGEFSEAFNTMIQQLDNRQKVLLKELEIGREKTQALVQSHSLLVDIMVNIPQRIIVTSNDSGDVLFINKAAKQEIDRDPDYMEKLDAFIAKRRDELEAGKSVEYIHIHGDHSRCMHVNAYQLQWYKANAMAYVISDDIKHIKDLELKAFRDSMTNLYNRFYGMEILNEWLDGRKRFVLCFIDLNNLKFVNDNYGHQEGDIYIITVADYLRTFSEDAVISRLGGDEFMILSEQYDAEGAELRMAEVAEKIKMASRVYSKEFSYIISYGIVDVGEDNTEPASTLLRLADDRMYIHKRRLKLSYGYAGL